MKEDGKEINETGTGRYANYIDRGQMVVMEVNWRRWQFALVRSEAESRVSCVMCHVWIRIWQYLFVDSVMQ